MENDNAAIQADEFFPSPTEDMLQDDAIAATQNKPEINDTSLTDASLVEGDEERDAELDSLLFPDGHPARQTQEPGSENADPNLPNKKRPDRFEYWQAEASKERARADQNTQLAEIGKLVLQNPAMLAQLTGQTAPTKAADPVTRDAEPTKIERPKAPEKPASYNEVEAYNDPASESFKYRKAVEQHRDAMLDYYAKRDEARDQKEQETSRRAEAQKAERAQLQQMQAVLQSKYGFKPQEAVDFIQTFQNPESINIDNLVALYKLQRGKKAGALDQRTKELLARQKRQGTPLPTGAAPGTGRTAVNAEQAFNLSLLRYSNKPKQQ